MNLKEIFYKTNENEYDPLHSKDTKDKINHNFYSDNHVFSHYEYKLESVDKKTNKCYFSGYASIFNNIDSQDDIILPGAFKNITKGKEYILLWQHNPSEPIGKITHMEENKNGLYVRGELSLGIAKAQDVYHMLKDQILDSMSIGYTALDYDFEYKNNQEVIRVIKNLHLWEVSLVTFPANQNAKITNIKNKTKNKEILDSNQEIDNLYKKLAESLDQTITILSNKNI